ncbi:BTB/POZ domain-containing protein 9-like [Adelges cooleyi]|uniref:BTB/POZ domain-containing protein 9-like n=1 Tax=Adelges cooleyi TaxID=133065 RepID=UPI002180106F|nr:BTB/POZ domain-containing protein 9-like [Adelges cooleyi]
MSISDFLALIILRYAIPAYCGPTENPSSSANPASDEQIDHTHFLTDECRRFDRNQFLNEEFSDVVLVVNNERFPAHRAVLASSSDYFRALLCNGHIETYTKEVSINEGSPTSIKELLKYIYFGKMNLSVLEINVILELLILSNLWRFINLQFSLSEYLCNNIDVHNVSSLFVVASYYQLKELEDASINFIATQPLDVLQSKKSRFLSAEALILILNRNTAYAKELDIFHAVSQWIKENQDKLGPNEKTNILSAIRYQLMDEKELSEVRRSELVRSDRNILDVIKKSLTQILIDRGRLEPNVNFAQEDSIELSQIDGGTMIMLDHPVNINYIEMELIEKPSKNYSYYIEVSIAKYSWFRVINHSNYDCRSIQRLWINRIYVRYIRIVGTKNSCNKTCTFNILKVMYNTDKMHLVEIKNGLIAPKYNVALPSMDAFVTKGTPNWFIYRMETLPDKIQNNILYDEYKNSLLDRGHTYHFLNSGCIEVQLAQPYLLSSMRMLLWEHNKNTYGYNVHVSVNHEEWYLIIDKSNKSCQSWQLLQFEQRLVVYIRITGIHTSDTYKTFNLKYLEAPAQVSLAFIIKKPWKSISWLLNRK